MGEEEGEGEEEGGEEGEGGEGGEEGVKGRIRHILKLMMVDCYNLC